MESIATWYSGLLNNKELVHYIVIWMGTVFPIYVMMVSSKFTFKVIGQEILNKKWLMLKVFFLVAVIFPLVVSGILKIFDVPLVLAAIMLIASVAVGDPFDLVDAHGKKGSLLMASTAMILLVFLMPLTVPFWIWVFSQWFPLHHLSAEPINILTKVSAVAIVPMFLGLLIRQLSPKFADKMAVVLSWYFKISAITITIIFFPAAIGKIVTIFGFTGIAVMMLVTTLTIISGYLVAKGETRKDRISISLACSLGNMAAVFFIAYHAYPDLEKNSDFLLTVFGWVVLRWLIIYGWYFFMKYRVKKHGETLE